MARLLTASRYVILLAVFGSLMASFIILSFASYEVVLQVLDAVRSGFHMKPMTHVFIEITDTFLIGTVLYLVALGLYELFIDDTLILPKTLRIESLDDLKDKLLGVIVLSMAVLFLGQVANWDGTQSIFYLGAGIALVIASLTWKFGTKKASN